MLPTHDPAVYDDQSTQHAPLNLDAWNKSVESTVRRQVEQQILLATSLVQHHIEPSNRLYNEWIQDIFTQLVPFVYVDVQSRLMHRGKIVQVQVLPPCVPHPTIPGQFVSAPPQNFEMMDATYDLQLILTVQHDVWGGDVLPAKLEDFKGVERENVIRHVPPNVTSSKRRIASEIQIPLMTWTQFCLLSRGHPEGQTYSMPNDRGAYFYAPRTKQFLSPIETTCCNYAFMSTKDAPPSKQRQSLGPNPWSVLHPNPLLPSASPAGRKRSNASPASSSRKKSSLIAASPFKTPSTRKASQSNTSVSAASLAEKKWYVLEIRCMHESKPFDTTRNFTLSLSGPSTKDEFGGYHCIANVQYGHSTLPITVLCMAFGWSVYDFADAVCWMCGSFWDKECWSILSPTLFRHPSSVTDAESAKKCIMQATQQVPVSQQDKHPLEKRMKDVELWMCNNHLPHMGVTRASFEAKNVFMAHMMAKLVRKARFPEQVKDDRRDHYSTRRLQLTDFLIANLLRQLVDRTFWHKVEVDFIKHLQSQKDDGSPDAIFNGSRLSSQLMSAISTGNWTTISNVSKQRKGVSMMMNMTNTLSYFASVRRNATVIQHRSTGNSSVRQMDVSHFGRNCPSETPEGDQCGLVRYPTIATRVSIGLSSEPLIELLRLFSNEFPLLNIQEWRRWCKPFLASRPPVSAPWVGLGKSQSESKESSKDSSNDSSSEPRSTFDPSRDCTTVSVNGTSIGWTQNPQSWLIHFRRMRRAGMIDGDTSISWTVSQGSQTIHIWSDAGRILRPLLVASAWCTYIRRATEAWTNLDKEWVQKDPQTGTISWISDCFSMSRLTQQGIVEYVDALEESTLSIRSANNWKEKVNHGEQITHVEIHDSWMFGTSASDIPWPNLNQSPRNTYQCAMAKQAFTCMGTPFIDQNGVNYVLHYGQRPLVQTRHSHDLHWEETATGINAKVLFMPKEHTPDDAIEINSATLDRCAWAGETTQCHRATTRRTSSANIKETFERPEVDKCLGMKDVDYSHLDKYGMAPLRAKIKNGQPLIGKTAMIPKMSSSSSVRFTDDVMIEQAYRKHDESVFLTGGESATVIRRMSSMQPKTHKEMRKIVTSTARHAHDHGDKYSSRHGQKGVLGQRVAPEDMPFDCYGNIPDLVMNPMAFPSRMTGAHEAEMHAGTVAALYGIQIDSTAFEMYDKRDMETKLVIKGLSANGTSTMYNGETGAMLEVPIFSGYIYIQRLRHIVATKYHARERGPYDPLTHQPVESRNRDGGLRYGAMETDCSVSAGTAEILRERSTTCSDEFTMWVCGRCGLIAIANPHYRYFYCRVCQKSSRIYPVIIGYATKLFLQELYSFGIYVCLELDETDEEKQVDDDNGCTLPDNGSSSLGPVNSHHERLKFDETKLCNKLKTWLDQLKTEEASLATQWQDVQDIGSEIGNETIGQNKSDAILTDAMIMPPPPPRKVNKRKQ
jgi:DNA-directed RNA polymerase beta subunit